jgi:aspartyl protease family protein
MAIKRPLCSRHFRRIAALLWLLPLAAAAEVSVVGLIRGKATLVIDGGTPRTLAVGQSTPEGVKLVAADSQSATVEIAGRRETIMLGARAVVVANAQAGPRSVTLYPDALGHFATIGSVNQVPVRFLVDSGATLVVLPVSEAQRAGIAYQRGERGTTLTANGPVGVYRIALKSVKIGELELNDVVAEVNEAPMNVALLGMSYLGRISMRRDGQQLTLSQKNANGGSEGKDAAATGVAGGHQSVTLGMQQGGHFFSEGGINGSPIHFLVDTGASLVSISAADARRMGIIYLRGERGWTMTANGRAPVYRLKFDEVRLGEIVLRNVDGSVHEGDGLPVALLGMSFLNRTDIRREGPTMTITRRF